MTGSRLILQPPRAYQFVILFHFDGDARSDEELRKDILDRVSLAASLGANMKAIAVQQVAYVPMPGAAAR